MDNFQRATSRARRCMRAMLSTGIPPIIAADAAIVQASAAWAAETGKEEYAAELLSIWAAIRDSK